ncbi:MAG: HAD family phosphatase [Lautropia sp.]|nr:HAD family phosphatase [Lautropia sp.]
MKRLALFDLDHTLLPIDSDHGWGQFLCRTGRIADSASYQASADAFYEQYKQGVLDPQAHLRFALSIIANRPAEEIEGWRQEYLDTVIKPQIRPQAQALVEHHRAQGDLCAIVTATNTFVAGPIAALFQVEHLLGAEGEMRNGRYTGNPQGIITFQAGKLRRIDQWLADMGLMRNDFDEIWAYSDSRNDLPMLELATHPVATNPDPVLRQTATERGWRVIDLFPAV